MERTKEENFLEFCEKLSTIGEEQFAALLILLNIEGYHDYHGKNHRPRAIEEIFREIFDKFIELSLKRQKSLLELLESSQKER